VNSTQLFNCSLQFGFNKVAAVSAVFMMQQQTIIASHNFTVFVPALEGKYFDSVSHD